MNRRVRFAALVLLATLAGCRQDMHDQAKYEAFERNEFFDDRRASRPAVPGSIPRGYLEDDDALYRGEIDGQIAANVPLAVDRALLERGRERYDIFCSPCHDRVGMGNGMIVQRGYKQAASFHEERLRRAADGYFFKVVTDGFGVMPSYAAQIPARDRWAIVVYIRALQLSQRADGEYLKADDLARLDDFEAVE